ncbi:MAG: 2OG-Fe(II) oxygenase [Verrucomicrobiota bacterium]
MTTKIDTDAVPTLFAEGEEQTIRKFWNAKPFPHVWIDDFLPRERFDRLVRSEEASAEKPDFEFNTSLERNKTTYSSDAVSTESQSLVASITAPQFLKEISRLTGIPDIIPLTEYKSQSLRFHHKMEDGGFLGSHVDHSAVREGRVHFLNCIFYGPATWKPEWGGQTLLFDKWGFREQARVECTPNRLLIFLHTSESFHGVARLTGNPHSRPTVYMDYYAKLNDLKLLDVQAARNGSAFASKFWRHYTTFVPRSLKDSLRYMHPYLMYLLRRGY